MNGLKDRAMTMVKPNSDDIDAIQLENLFIRDADVFQTSLHSEDYLDSLVPIITDALRANALSDFIVKLNNIVKAKDDELNDISLNSAHDINTCIDTIDTVSTESQELSVNLSQVNKILNKSVFELISKKKALIKCKETSQKIEETSVVLNLCIQVLEISNKILDWIKQHKYFSALKLIDELSSIHLPKVKDFTFAVKIYDSIPHLTAMIKEESFDSLSKWLSTHIERKVDVIGECIFANLAELQENWEKLRNNAKIPALLPHHLNSPVEVSMRDPSLYLNVFDSKELQIPLAPIYDCILVYQSLNDIGSLASIYHKEWMKKYQRIIYPITLSANVKGRQLSSHDPSVSFQNLESLAAYLQKIAAFFVVDKQLNKQTKFELRSNSTADDLWESYSVKLKPVLINFLQSHKWGVNDLGILADFKDLLGNFLQVMENSQYKISDLYTIMIDIFRDYFGPILIQHFRIEFIDSIQSDHYMPLVVTDRHDYDNVMKICWYKKDANFAPRNVHSMPISFPFSEDYVHYCLGIRTLLKDVLEFTSRHYSHELSDLNHIIVNDIFEKVLGNEPGIGICNDIKEFISKNSNNKEIVAQSYTNLEYYLFSLYEIGKLLDERLRATNGIGIINIDTHSVFKLKAIELFTSIRKFSEDAIFKMVDVKLKELLDMVEYDDWMPQTSNTDPNFFILDFSLFLENLFNSIFTNLPSSFRTLGLFRSFDFIAEYFLNILEDAPHYNRIAISNLNLDITHLEKSMANLAQSESNDPEQGSVALQSTFETLRQSIDLLLLENYDEFIKNPSFRMRRFDRLKYEDAMKLIKKMQVPRDDADNQSIAELTNANSSILDRESSLLSKWKFRISDQ